MAEFNYSTPLALLIQHMCAQNCSNMFQSFCTIVACRAAHRVICIDLYPLICSATGLCMVPALLAYFESHTALRPCCIWVSESTQVHPHESAKANTRVQGAISLACRICNDLRQVRYRGGLLNRARGFCTLSIFGP